jgi:hypothetical protein
MNRLQSSEFPGPLVRVRGVLSRAGVVGWCPAIRTFKAEPDISLERDPSRSPMRLPNVDVNAVRSKQQRELLERRRSADGEPLHTVQLQDAGGTPLEEAIVRPMFAHRSMHLTMFGRRMAYSPAVRRLVLRRGSVELGQLDVTGALPRFELVTPATPSHIDPAGILHLTWRAAPGQGLMYTVRYSWDGERWNRPLVNSDEERFDLDLREMPGGSACRVQVIATNGYQTAFVETPHFKVPVRAPRLILDLNEGPKLFAQGFSLEEGPIVGDAIAWFAATRTESEGIQLLGTARLVGRGGELDVRSLGTGFHRVEVQAVDHHGRLVRQRLGVYDGSTGRRASAKPGR